MFILKENGLEFAFDSQIGVKNEGGFYESEINGAIPVPKLLSTDRINGCLAVCQKIFASGEYHGENKGFVAWAYITAFIISALVCIFLKFHKSSKKNSLLKITPQIAALGISAGAVLAVFQWLNTYAVSVIDSTILFPSYSGGSMVLSALSGVLLLRDKLTKKQICSVVLGAAAVIILTL